MKGVNSEIDFEKKIRRIIKEEIISLSDNILMFDSKKGADILLFRNGESPSIFIVEVKYYINSHGRLGFGDKKGRGFQTEGLKQRPDFLETNMIWLLGSEDSEDFFWLENETIIEYVSGSRIDSKHNNFQAKIFDEIKGLSKSDLIDKLSNWFKV